MKEQQQIRYKDVMELGFIETQCPDNVFRDEYGYDYKVVEFKIAKLISIYWDIETRTCELIRINNNVDCDIRARYPIKNLEELKTIIDFFKA